MLFQRNLRARSWKIMRTSARKITVRETILRERNIKEITSTRMAIADNQKKT